MSWYNFRSDGSDPFFNEHNFGVLHADLTPKPAYRALATVCRSMDQGHPVRRTDLGDDIWALNMGDATALWTNRTLVDLILTSQDPIEAVNLMGEPMACACLQGRATLRLRANCPVFVTGQISWGAAKKVTLPGRRPSRVQF